MPGLIGFTDKRRQYDNKMLLSMRAVLKYFDWYVDEELYSDTACYSSRTHIGVLNQGRQPFVSNNRYFSWLEGEFYNEKELTSKYGVACANHNEVLATIYNTTKSFEYLADIDGYFAAVVYDKKENEIHLITDRFGYKPLYWGRIHGNMAWSSELKGFLGHKDFTPVIDGRAVQQFFDFGYILENRTWFEGIELVPPASVLTFQIEKSEVRIEPYWSWSDIQETSRLTDEIELAEELGRLFKEAVYRRVKKREKIGLLLSGGLDSRAVLAALPDDYIPLHAFTFGQRGCRDIRIARKASRVRGSKHHILHLNSENWFLPRITEVWKSDAAVGLLHMHGVEFWDKYKSHIDFFLHGFAGDLVLGGSYLRKNNLDKRIDSATVRNITHCQMEVSQFEKWYMISKTDPYFINNRVRRFTNCGLTLTSKLLDVRIPFWDIKLVEFVYGIPDFLRYKSRIYNKMLLMAFPEYYTDIPWQKTGFPIAYSEFRVRLAIFQDRVLRGLKRESQRFGFRFKDLRDFADYPAWIRQEPAKSVFEKLLLNKRALFVDYIDRDEICGYLRDHMGGKLNYDNQLCLALTFELWLQQVFEGRYRSFSMNRGITQTRNKQELHLYS